MEDILKKAEQIAREAHKGQTRWGGEPYITHPEAVASKFENEDYKIVAWLHDIIEDTSLVMQDLLDKGIPEELVKSIIYLTKTNRDNYLDYILDLKKNEIARLVKIEDLKHNLSKIKPGSMKDKYLLALYILQIR